MQQNRPTERPVTYDLMEQRIQIQRTRMENNRKRSIPDPLISITPPPMGRPPPMQKLPTKATYSSYKNPELVQKEKGNHSKNKI